MKPFSTYPEDRVKLLQLAATVLADDSVMVGPAAIELADLVRATAAPCADGISLPVRLVSHGLRIGAPDGAARPTCMTRPIVARPAPTSTASRQRTAMRPTANIAGVTPPHPSPQEMRRDPAHD